MAEQINDESVKQGHILQVWNTKKPKFSNANRIYYVIHCENGDKEFPIMLTKRELDTAKRRAERNPEDVPKRSFLTNILD